MEPAWVMLAAAISGAREDELPEHLKLRVQDEEFWQGLEATPPDQLTPDQLEVIGALGLQVWSE